MRDNAAATVIGMQEIADAANTQKLAQILTDITGHPWDVQHFPERRPASTEEAIFWRRDLWTPIGCRHAAGERSNAAGQRKLSVVSRHG